MRDHMKFRIFFMMFCLGMSAMLAQIVMTRELMVAYYGNELAIGIIFAVWLLMVSVGSLVIRPFLSRLAHISHRRKPPARHALLPQSFAAKVSARCWRTLPVRFAQGPEPVEGLKIALSL